MSGYQWVSSIKTIRMLLQNAGSANAVDRETLLAHRADVLEIRDHASRLSQPGSPLASLFTLSPEVIRLIERIALESTREPSGAAARFEPTTHERRTELPPQTSRVA